MLKSQKNPFFKKCYIEGFRIRPSIWLKYIILSEEKVSKNENMLAPLQIQTIGLVFCRWRCDGLYYITYGSKGCEFKSGGRWEFVIKKIFFQHLNSDYRILSNIRRTQMQDAPLISKLSLRKKSLIARRTLNFFELPWGKRSSQFSRSRNTTGLSFELYLHVQTPSFCHIVCLEGTIHTDILFKVWIQTAEIVKIEIFWKILIFAISLECKTHSNLRRTPNF